MIILKPQAIPDYVIGDRVKLTQGCITQHNLFPFATVKKDESNNRLYIGAIHSTTNEEWKIDISDTVFIDQWFKVN